jgi:hypothetical protein
MSSGCLTFRCSANQKIPEHDVPAVELRWLESFVGSRGRFSGPPRELSYACGCRKPVPPGRMLRWPLGRGSGRCEAGLGAAGRGMIFGLWA